VDTQFAIASGVKGFTALAVLSLVEEGSLGLDTSVRAVLGDVLVLVDPAVTVRHLLTHTSGIGDYLDESVGDVDDYAMTVPVQQLATTADYLAVLRGHPMAFPVGERFEYCNGGFVVLALVVEAVTGRPFPDVVAERVWAPAGMEATGFLRSDQLPGTAALGYVEGATGWRTNWFHLPVRGSGDGGAYTTLDDVSRFWTALFAGAIVPAPVVAEMVRPHQDAPAHGLRYGLGFWLRPDGDTVLLEGCDAGVSFRSAFDPASAASYTVVSNTTDGAWPLVRLLDGRLGELAVG
ncbi:MAG TPA: serine hydrolase domain-containing protein, partial [Acidimicrobiales bacterium]